jgi:hypothetical protein
MSDDRDQYPLTLHGRVIVPDLEAMRRRLQKLTRSDLDRMAGVAWRLYQERKAGV